MILLHELRIEPCTNRGRQSSARRLLWSICRRGSLIKVSTQPSDREANDESHMGLGPGSAPNISRWIKVLAVAAVLLVFLVFVVLHLTGVLGPGAHE